MLVPIRAFLLYSLLSYLPEFIKRPSASAMHIQFDVKEDDSLPWIRAFGFMRARRGKGKKALGNCAPNSVLLIVHVTTPYVDLPLGAFPRYLQIREAVDITPAVYFTVCYILYAIIFNY